MRGVDGLFPKPQCQATVGMLAEVGRRESHGLLFHVTGGTWATAGWRYPNQNTIKRIDT